MAPAPPARDRWVSRAATATADGDPGRMVAASPSEVSAQRSRWWPQRSSRLASRDCGWRLHCGAGPARGEGRVSSLAIVRAGSRRVLVRPVAGQPPRRPERGGAPCRDLSRCFLFLVHCRHVVFYSGDLKLVD